MTGPDHRLGRKMTLPSPCPTLMGIAVARSKEAPVKSKNQSDAPVAQMDRVAASEGTA
jgi:hypothetical protein